VSAGSFKLTLPEGGGESLESVYVAIFLGRGILDLVITI